MYDKNGFLHTWTKTITKSNGKDAGDSLQDVHLFLQNVHLFLHLLQLYLIAQEPGPESAVNFLFYPVNDEVSDDKGSGCHVARAESHQKAIGQALPEPSAWKGLIVIDNGIGNGIGTGLVMGLRCSIISCCACSQHPAGRLYPPCPCRKSGHTHGCGGS